MTNTPTQSLAKPSIVYYETSTGFRIYLTSSADSYVYLYNSEKYSWTTLGGVVPHPYYDGLPGAYQLETNSIYYSTSSFYDDSTLSTSSTYSWRLQIDSGFWSPVAPRPIELVTRYSSALLNIGNSRLAVTGGAVIGNSVFSSMPYECISNKLQIWDLICGTWTALEVPGTNRIGHAAIFRNNSIILFGGSDGRLHNDMTTYPLSESQFPSSKTPRDTCKCIVRQLI